MLERIEQARIERHMTVKQLSTISGVPEATYSNIIKGRSANPSFQTVQALALALGLSLDDAVAAASASTPPEIIDTIQRNNNTPATTQEVDNALGVLMRLMEDNNKSYQAAIKSRNDEFERALLSKDAQFERERAELLAALHTKDKWIRILFAACASLCLFICFMLLLDIMHHDVGWIRSAFSDLFTWRIGLA